MATTHYFYSSPFTFQSDNNKTINAKLYFKYEVTETDTQYILHAATVGIAFQKASASDPNTSFQILKNSWAKKNVITPNGTEHNSTLTRSTDKTLWAESSGTEWDHQYFGEWDDTYTYTVNKTTSTQSIEIRLEGVAYIKSDYAGTKSFSAGNRDWIRVATKTLFTVTLKPNGGTDGSVKAFMYYYGSSGTFPTAAQSPTKGGYTFVGWSKSSSATTATYTAGASISAHENAIYYAIWKKTLTLSYSGNTGSGVPSSQSATIYNATTSHTFTISSSRPTKSGYVFLGWSRTANATSAAYSPGSQITISSNTTLYAIWRKTLTLSHDANGGSGAPSSQTANVYNGQTSYTFTLSSTTPTRSGYTFLGWSKSSSATSASYAAGGTITVSINTRLYAIWKKTITVSYNANGGSGAPSSQSATIYNATTSYTFTLSSTKPTRAGYIFLGWGTSSTATSASYQPGATVTLTSSLALYAVWQPDATLGVSTSSTENSYTISTSVNAEVTRQVKIYQDGTLIATKDVKGSNSFTFTGKKPETSYTIRVDLLNGSTVIATKTVKVATLNADITLTGSNTNSTYTSVKAVVSGIKAGSTFTKTIEWQYALASSPNNKTTFSTVTIGTNATSNTAVITGLLPGRAYNITALYYVDGYQTDTKTISLSTNAASGDISVTNKSASTFIIALKNFTKIDYAIKVRAYYREASTTKWSLAQVHDVYSNAQVDIYTTISNLKASTKYDLQYEVRRASDNSLIWYRTIQDTTKAYVPGAAPTPFIDEFLVVPHARMAYIRWHVEGDMTGFTLKLKEKTTSLTVENTYTLTGSEGIKTLNKSSVQTRVYELTVVDGNQDEHNTTVSITIDYTDLPTLTYSADAPIIVNANDMYREADALLKLFDYREVTKIRENKDSHRQAYARLKELMTEGFQGNVIKGNTVITVPKLSLVNIIYELAALFKAGTSRVRAVSGEQITAYFFNSLMTVVEETLASYRP